MRNKLRSARLKKGYSQQELSDLSGVSRTTISGLENNQIETVTNTTLVKICNALNEKVSEIFFID